MSTTDRLRPLLRLAVAVPALPPAVAWFFGRALCVAISRRDVFTLRSAATPRQVAELLRLARGRRRVVELVGASGVEASAMDGPGVDLLFIDASHERQATIDEWRAWRPRLAPGGLVVFHDYDHPGFPGVAQAIAHLGLVGRPHAGMFIWRVPRG